jgi:hypothetical protein
MLANAAIAIRIVISSKSPSPRHAAIRLRLVK